MVNIAYLTFTLIIAIMILVMENKHKATILFHSADLNGRWTKDDTRLLNGVGCFWALLTLMVEWQKDIQPITTFETLDLMLSSKNSGAKNHGKLDDPSTISLFLAIKRGGGGVDLSTNSMKNSKALHAFSGWDGKQPYTLLHFILTTLQSVLSITMVIRHQQNTATLQRQVTFTLKQTSFTQQNICHLLYFYSE